MAKGKKGSQGLHGQVPWISLCPSQNTVPVTWKFKSPNIYCSLEIKTLGCSPSFHTGLSPVCRCLCGTGGNKMVPVSRCETLWWAERIIWTTWGWHPCPRQGDGMKWSLRSFPTKTSLWFHGSVILPPPPWDPRPPPASPSFYHLPSLFFPYIHAMSEVCHMIIFHLCLLPPGSTSPQPVCKKWHWLSL